MGQNWYYARGTEQFGPVTIEQLQGLISTGQVQPIDLVWTDGMALWAPMQSVPELSAPAGSPGVATMAAPGPAAIHYAPGLAQPAMGQPYPGQLGVLGYQTPAFPQFQYGTFWIRFCGAFLDGIIIWIANTVINVILFAMAGDNYFNHIAGQQAPLSPGAAVASGIGSILGIVVGWLYVALQQSSPKQATVGQRAVGVMVVDLNGQRISFARATGRHFASIISSCTLLIGFLMCAFTERKQTLHDMIASTLVIQKPPESPFPR